MEDGILALRQVGEDRVMCAVRSWLPGPQNIIITRRTFIKRHKSRNIHSDALYMSMYTCVVEL